MMKHRISASEAEKLYAARVFEVELLDELTGRIAVSCRQSVSRVMGRWQLEVDGKRDSFGQFLLNGMVPGERREFLLSVEVPDLHYGERAVLIIRFYDENNVELAAESFLLPPPAYFPETPAKEQFFTGVRFDVSQAIISSGKLSAVIDANGMRELLYNGEKRSLSGPRISLWRSQMVPEKLKELELDRIRISADRFVSDGKSVESHALVLPKKMEMDELEFTQKFTPQEDGSIRYDAEFVVPECFADIPRLGVMLRLPGDMKKVTFLGKGPFENYAGGKAGIFSEYTFPAGEMYPELKEALSAGNRSGVRRVRLESEDQRMVEIFAGNEMNITVLPFSEYAIDDAAKAGKMPENEGDIYLYIDCRIGEKQPVRAGFSRMSLFFRAR